MRNFIKKSFYCIIFAALFLCLLFYPKLTLSYASTGLTLWFSKMIPTLLPFMILSSLLIKLQLHQTFIGFLAPVLRPIFRVNSSCLYAIVVGFCCGFPMGAKVVAELYLAHKITKSEAEFLLAFCNNIGPIYFISFVLFSLQITNYLPFLFGMYGIPLCYGILLRYGVYRKKLHFPAQTERAADWQKGGSFFRALDDSIMNSLNAITKLGGYMILFNLCNCIPVLLFSQNTFLMSFINCMLEITSGIQYTLGQNLAYPYSYLIVFPLLLFGGISCFAQTASILRDTDLSQKKYCTHKLVQYFLSLSYYFVYLRFIINLN